ncbi:hypothetical protein HDU85_002956 [Gaertneriomyces sp. JEL0708]|nr:hypothetical protein HDU85_002956 [Gaertneriomyces sp. JEL0708]
MRSRSVIPCFQAGLERHDDAVEFGFWMVVRDPRTWISIVLYATLPILLFFPSFSARYASPFFSTYDYAATAAEGIWICGVLGHLLLEPIIRLDKRQRLARLAFAVAFIGISLAICMTVTMDYHFQKLVGKIVGTEEVGIFLSSWDKAASQDNSELSTDSFRYSVYSVTLALYGSLLAYVCACHFGQRFFVAITPWRSSQSRFSNTYLRVEPLSSPEVVEMGIRRILRGGLALLMIVAVLGRGYSPLSNVLLSTAKYLWTSGDSFLESIMYKDLDTPAFQRNGSSPNIVLIEMESLSREYMYSAQGRKSVPGYYKFLKDHADDLFEFPFTHAPAGLTAMCVPALMSGSLIVSDKPEHTLEYLSLPGLATYAKQRNYTTAVFSASDVHLKAKNWHAITSVYTHDFDIVHSPDREPLKGKVKYAMDFAMDDRELLSHFIKESKGNPRFTENPVAMLMVFNHLHHPYLVDKDKYTPPKGLTQAEIDQSRYHWSLKNVFEPNFEALMRHIDSTLPGGLQNTVIAFTGDHGESKDRIWNISLQSISTPMWLHVPKGLIAEERRQTLRRNKLRPVSTMDVVPTLIDLLGYDADMSLKSGITINGTSLLNPLPEDRVVLGWHAQPYIEFNQILIVNRGIETLMVDMTRKRVQLFEFSEDAPSAGIPKIWSDLSPDERRRWLEEPRRNHVIVDKLNKDWPSFLPSLDE